MVERNEDFMTNRVFTFGSNELGKHFGGAAKSAVDNHGAVLGQGFGPQGNSFAIPTCTKPCEASDNHSLPDGLLNYYVFNFILYAILHPELEFQVTRIGCGLAGLKDEDVAPLFSAAPDNCLFDEKWKGFLPKNKRYWGTF
jgi:hypothetical protein